VTGASGRLLAALILLALLPLGLALRHGGGTLPALLVRHVLLDEHRVLGAQCSLGVGLPDGVVEQERAHLFGVQFEVAVARSRHLWLSARRRSAADRPACRIWSRGCRAAGVAVIARLRCSPLS
jgi:hypothetical protein